MAWGETVLRTLFGQPKKRPAKTRPHAKGGPSRPSAPRRRPVAKTSDSNPQTREALLKEAMRIHRAKRALLEDLSDEDKFLLRIMAHQIVGGGGDKPPDEEPTTDTSIAAPHALRQPDNRDR